MKAQTATRMAKVEDYEKKDFLIRETELDDEKSKRLAEKKKKFDDFDEDGGFANAEDFAHLLDEDAEKEVNNKEKKFFKEKTKRPDKRTFTAFESA